MKFLEHSDMAPGSRTRVTDTMYEYCRWLSEKNHDRNCLANIELTDAAEKWATLGEHPAWTCAKRPRLPRCPNMD